ncbi:hypothetical protein ACF059_17490 [Streptomyces sp. NPDC016562]|uniref:hypothetical protein n=1 Tax=Streptomyces sp. NPDC016562 TaxID=3364966 RepID=UPI0036FC7ACD
MPADVAQRLDRLPEARSYDDLKLTIDTFEHLCDSSYLSMDLSPTDTDDLGGALSRLLEQWMIQIEGLRSLGGTAYLPYDFADQCTAWLRVSSTDGHAADVQAGWSEIPGWDVNPFDYIPQDREVLDFKPLPEARITCLLDDLAARINANRIALASTGN